MRLSGIRLLREETFFRSLERGEIGRLPGFDKRRGHFVPKECSSRATAFVARLLEGRIRDESQAVYDGIKQRFRLRRGQVSRAVDDRGAAVDCRLIRVEWYGEQDPASPTRYRLTIRMLPREVEDWLALDAVLPTVPDELVVPLSEPPSFDVAVGILEDVAAANGIESYEDEDEGVAGLRLNGGTCLELRTIECELSVRTSRGYGCGALLREAQAALGELANIPETTGTRSIPSL